MVDYICKAEVNQVLPDLDELMAPVDLHYNREGLDDEQAQAQAEAQAQGPRQITELPKTGRNDPCPCGSGLKYKSCHMHNPDELLELLSSQDEDDDFMDEDEDDELAEAGPTVNPRRRSRRRESTT